MKSGQNINVYLFTEFELNHIYLILKGTVDVFLQKQLYNILLSTVSCYIVKLKCQPLKKP